MSVSTLTAIPATITQGTTVAVELSYVDWDAGDGDSLTLVLQSEKQKHSFSGVADGTGWLLTLRKADTAAMFPGVYSWQVFCEEDESSLPDRQCVDSGLIYVLEDIVADQTPKHDPRSHAEKMLATYNEQLSNVSFLKTLQPDQIEALERIRKGYEWQVKREQDAMKLKAGGYPTRKIFTRFPGW